MKRAIAVLLALAGAAWAAPAPEGAPLRFSFTNVAARAGLDAITVYGGRDTNRYLLETTGCGAAFLDYDADGWPDIFLVNGTTLEGYPAGKEPTSHLYRNRRDGTFEDVTRAAGVGATGWGQAACAGDLDNDGHEDLFVSALRAEPPLPQPRDRRL